MKQKIINMYKYLCVFLIVSAFSACKKQDEILTQTPKSTDAKTDSVSQDTAVTDLKSDIHEGIYITNLNTKSFRDCSNPDSLYWVADDSRKLEAQYKKMFETASVYNSIYIKVKGEIIETKDATTREKYPRTIRVKEVISAEKKNYNNTCVKYDFWAFGNDPGWSLQISKNENVMEFNYPGEKKTYFFFYAEPAEEDGYVIYRNHNKIQGHIIIVRLRKLKCTDKASGKEYEYSAAVELNGEKLFTGCAIKGKE